MENDFLICASDVRLGAWTRIKYAVWRFIPHAARRLPPAASCGPTDSQADDPRRSLSDVYSEITQSGDCGRRAAAWAHALFLIGLVLFGV